MALEFQQLSSNSFKSVRNVIQMTLKYLLFPLALPEFRNNTILKDNFNVWFRPSLSKISAACLGIQYSPLSDYGVSVTIPLMVTTDSKY